MVNIEKAMVDPSSEFQSPREVLNDYSLSREQKIDILRRWAYDEREMSVAEEENMLKVDNENNENILDEILKALLELGVNSDQESPPPTKQG